jgi:nucleotide-binding universal stress UspA family protein
MYKRILVPLDGSPLSEAVLSHVKPLAIAVNAEIVLLEIIVDALQEFSKPTSALTPPRETKRIQTESTTYLKGVCARLEEEGLRTSYLVRQGDVVTTILEVAEIMRVDVIAMSTHGRSGAKLLLLGSISYEVVRKSPHPVLMIRAR